MIKATALDLRKALLAANTYASAGMNFVPIPVFNAQDHAALVAEAENRLARMLATAESTGAEMEVKKCGAA